MPLTQTLCSPKLKSSTQKISLISFLSDSINIKKTTCIIEDLDQSERTIVSIQTDRQRHCYLEEIDSTRSYKFLYAPFGERMFINYKSEQKPVIELIRIKCVTIGTDN